MQELWNEEAAILEAGDASPAQEEIVVAEEASPSPDPEPASVEPVDPGKRSVAASRQNDRGAWRGDATRR